MGLRLDDRGLYFERHAPDFAMSFWTMGSRDSTRVSSATIDLSPSVAREQPLASHDSIACRRRQKKSERSNPISMNPYCPPPPPPPPPLLLGREETESTAWA